MDLADILEYFDPHEYEGLVFAMPAEFIGRNLAREVARVGSMELWQYQSVVNHDHPSIGLDVNPVEIEFAYALAWRQVLCERFPEHSFVIETRPTDQMTWFQLTKTAPYEDDVDFQDFCPSFSISAAEFRKAMEEMKEAGFGAKEAREKHMEAFHSRTPRTGSVGTCELCQSGTGFSDPVVSDKYRGIRFMNCSSCGKELIHSTKTIREVVSPD